MEKFTIAIDARELARKKLRSLGLIILSIMKYMEEFNIILLSDIEVSSDRIPLNAVNYFRGDECRGGLDFYYYQKWMKKIIKKKNVDCFYQINHFTLVAMKVPVITVVHDLYPLENIEKTTIKNKFIYKLSMILSIINSDKIFTVSNFTKERLKHFFWNSKKFEVNYNGLDLPLKNCNEKSIIDGKYMLMIGRISYLKGTLHLARIYDKFLSNSGYKLVIAGEAIDIETGNKLKKLTNKNKNIIWLDYVTNETRETLMSNCSLFLYPSRYDGFGLPPIELALRRKTVIMNDIPILREITKNCGDYINFYEEDYKVSKYILNKLCNENFEQIKKLYNIASTYTWERNVLNLKKTINELCKK